MGSGAMGKSKKTKKDKKEKKKKSKKEASSSSSSSSDSESENSEEIKRERAMKMAKKLANRLKQGEIAGYTDQENPFGDANLTERFVWHKKIERSLMSGVDPKELGLKAEKRRHVDRLKEIEKVKEQRETRDREKMEKEEEREIMQREQALIEAVELEQKEEEFHVQQARMRSDIRMKEGRARAVDIISRNFHAEPGSADYDPSVHPLGIFDGLTLTEIDELRDDLRVYLTLNHKVEEHRRFWSCMLVVADSELTEAKRREDMDRARVRGLQVSREVLEQGLHSSVEGDVKEMLEGKSLAELEELEGEIERAVNGPDAMEVEYWGAVLKRIIIHKARITVGAIDSELRSAQLNAVPRDVPPPPPAAKLGGAGAGDSDDDEDLLGADFGKDPDAKAAAGGDDSEDEEGGEFSPRGVSPEPYQPEGTPEPEGTPDRSFSPEAIRAREDEPDYLEVVDEEADKIQLAALREKEKLKKLKRFKDAARSEGHTVGAKANNPRAIDQAVFDTFTENAKTNAHPSGGTMQHIVAGAGELEEQNAADAKVEAESTRKSLALAEKMMGDSAGAEVTFAGEAPLEAQVYWWHDKYRPRKPKYFNRVHTGYEWNKYNQTHYDHDNPPPKTVQGYKFNLFFPDLIEKHKAPTYTIMPDGSKHGETCILRIHAGPPYEDIAFKIVNKEWEYSNKKGFRCSFERGIFHLYINFKRAMYRR